MRVFAFPDGLYVMRAAGAPELLGGRLLEIDGKPIDEVMRRLEALRGGTPQWRRAYASLYLYYQDFLYGTDVAQDPDKSTWTVESPSGARVTRILEAKVPPESAPYAYVKRWLSSEPFPGMTEGWQVFQPDSGLPLSLQDYDTAFRRLRLANSCVMFLQYKSNDDEAPAIHPRIQRGNGRRHARAAALSIDHGSALRRWRKLSKDRWVHAQRVGASRAKRTHL